MSASLVGSEMCIRDSSSDFRQEVEAVAAGQSFRELPALFVESLLPLKYCLLYTSDAADDM
eukprot:8123448-Alexandrium_andersonii.AAC.1